MRKHPWIEPECLCLLTSDSATPTALGLTSLPVPGHRAASDLVLPFTLHSLKKKRNGGHSASFLFLLPSFAPSFHSSPFELKRVKK